MIRARWRGMITGVSTGVPCQRVWLLNYDQIFFTVTVTETHLTKQSRRGCRRDSRQPPTPPKS
jgi:hypothetical protein